MTQEQIKERLSVILDGMKNADSRELAYLIFNAGILHLLHDIQFPSPPVGAKQGGAVGKRVSEVGKEFVISKSETVNHVSELRMLKQLVK